MPRLPKQYTGLHGIDLDQFPSEVTLKHGKEGEREWWEWWDNIRRKGRKGIVIQRPNQKLSFVIFFEQGERSRTLELPLTKEDTTRGVVARCFGAYKIAEAIKALSDLGINATLEGKQ